MKRPTLVFGTYRLKGEVLEDSLFQALDQLEKEAPSKQQVLCVDGAAKYDNLLSICKALHRFPQAQLGYKLEWKRTDNNNNNNNSKKKKRTLQEQLDVLVTTLQQQGLSQNRLLRILLHNYAGPHIYDEFQTVVETTLGKEVAIGICNVTTAQLESLLPFRRIDWVQNECHAFLPRNVAGDVPLWCARRGICFEAHSVMTHLDQYPRLLDKCRQDEERGQTPAEHSLVLPPAQLALSFVATCFAEAAARAAATTTETPPSMDLFSICFSTTNFSHLRQNISFAVPLAPEWYDRMRCFCQYLPWSKYYRNPPRFVDRPHGEGRIWIQNANRDYLQQTIVPQLLQDLQTFQAYRDAPPTVAPLVDQLSDLCYQIPKGNRRSNWKERETPIHVRLAQELLLLHHHDMDSIAHVVGASQRAIGKLRRRRALQEEALSADSFVSWTSTQLDVTLQRMRNAMEESRRRTKYANQVCARPVQAVVHPEALPVEDFPDASEFTDLIQFLRQLGKRFPKTTTITTAEDPEVKQQEDKEEEEEKKKDLCKQGVKNAFEELSEAVIADAPSTNVRFQHGTVNADGRLDLCKQGVKNAFEELSHAVIADAPSSNIVRTNVRFQHGTVNADGRLDLCKQGVKNAFEELSEAVISDAPSTNVRFQHGTVNADGRLDLCKQGVKNAFEELSEAVISDAPSTNVRFQHGTVNADGRLDLCKQGVKNAFEELSEAVISDAPSVLSTNVRFQHGTVNADGRLDLCKQGIRNAFGDLTDAVIADNNNDNDDAAATGGGIGFIRHFLFGNNRIGEGEGAGDRVAALARMIRHRPDITTWFLAGNELDAHQIQVVCEALQQAHSARYVWFKMNPIKTGARHCGKLLMKNPSIELLDLFNCGICDNGVRAFWQGLCDGAAQDVPPEKKTVEVDDAGTRAETTTNDAVAAAAIPNLTGLKHLYLSINAITLDALDDLEAILAILGDKLESFYINSNELGDEGICRFSKTVQRLASMGLLRNLLRLNLGSNGLTDQSLPFLVQIVQWCPNLICLDLSSYRSTKFFALQHNRFTNTQLLFDIAASLKQNAKKRGNSQEVFFGFQSSFQAAGEEETNAKASVLKKDTNVIVDGSGEESENVETDEENKGVLQEEELEDEYFPTQTPQQEHEIPHPEKVYATKTAKQVEELLQRIQVELNINVNGIQSRNDFMGGRLVSNGLSARQMHALSHPLPAVDYILSIYRNTMK